jgi:hypothetical protein
VWAVSLKTVEKIVFSFNLSAFLKTHPLTPSLFKRGGTASLATSYPLSRRERGEG